MFKWAQSALSVVAGTQEPIYGPEAIKSVAEEAKTTPYTELTRDDLKWEVMESTSVETQTFYFMTDAGKLAFLPAFPPLTLPSGIRTTCQFNCKIFSLDGSAPHLWSSTPLHNHDFSDDKTAFYADDCAVELSEDGTTFTIKCMADENAIVNLTVKRTAPGPRQRGTITTKEGPVDLKGKAFFSHALQGMKPHHAAAKWNFCNFQGPTHSAILMHFTTPASYGSTVVTVGVIAKDGEIIVGGCQSSATHLDTKSDGENGWPEPATIKYTWSGTTKDGKPVEAVIEGGLEEKLDRIDVMAEVPGFVKSIVAAAAGTKPYIYQYSPQKTKMSLKLKVGDEEITEEGSVFAEATFVSE
ncbi:putative cell survival pathways protein [Collariella sp. IMI 366227]|nr:putative cell survival pathways protein [Collariella sp. IMI 366227]